MEDQPVVFWGNVDFFIYRDAVVDEQRDPSAHNVIIHTRALTPDKRGNMQVTLNLEAYAIEISLYGIEESDAMTKYFNHEG